MIWQRKAEEKLRNIVRKTRFTLLFGGVLLVGLLACATRNLSDWAKVSALPVGTSTEVHLYKDAAPDGNWKIQGHFHSAEDEEITLKLKDGQTRTFQKETVFKARASQPPSKRHLLTSLLAITTGTLIGHSILDTTKGELAASLAALPCTAGLIYILDSRMKDIYKAPQPGNP